MPRTHNNRGILRSRLDRDVESAYKNERTNKFWRAQADPIGKLGLVGRHAKLRDVKRCPGLSDRCTEYRYRAKCDGEASSSAEGAVRWACLRRTNTDPHPHGHTKRSPTIALACGHTPSTEGVTLEPAIIGTKRVTDVDLQGVGGPNTLPTLFDHPTDGRHCHIDVTPFPVSLAVNFLWGACRPRSTSTCTQRQFAAKRIPSRWGGGPQSPSLSLPSSSKVTMLSCHARVASWWRRYRSTFC